MTPCKLWTGYVNHNGYGVRGIGSRTDGTRRTVLVHRHAWESARGGHPCMRVPLPAHIDVCHSCDISYPPQDRTYRRCFELDHLFLGTKADNNRDRDAKGRTARGAATRNRQTVITDDIAARMRSEADKLRNPNGRLHRGGRAQLASQFNVSERLIQSVLNGESWRRPDLVSRYGPFARVTVLP